MVDRSAHAALLSARRLREVVAAHPTGERDFPHLVNAVAVLEAAVRQTLQDDLLAVNVGGRPGMRHVTMDQLRQRLYRARAKLAEVKKQHEHVRDNFHNGIGAHWLVHAGLSDPSTPVRCVADWCRDFNAEVPAIARTSVGAVRDAFCETLKAMAASHLKNYCSDSPHGWILIKQVHDEASMRLRSFLQGSMGVKRGRSSKIQNSVISVNKTASQTDFVRVPVELMALERKDAPTMATALLRSLQEVLQAVDPTVVMRGLHVVIGDGIATNEAACRLLFGFMCERRFLTDYRLFFLRCSTHQANLVVKRAVCGPGHKHKDHPLISCCSRFFKHLLPHNVEEFSTNLRLHAGRRVAFRNVATMTKEETDSARDRANATRSLQRLYGKGVLPDSLIQAINGDLSGLECLHTAGTKGNSLSEVLCLLHKHCLQVEEKPVVTRFHLFADCVHCLLRWKMLNLTPEDVLSVHTKQPTEQSQARLKKVKGYMVAEGTSLELRRAALCLQLTMYATNLTGQKVVPRQPATSQEPPASEPQPTLLRLARGGVSQWVWQQLDNLVTNFHADPALTGHEGHLLECLAAVAGELQARFQQYETWPARVVLLSQTFNPNGCGMAALELLQANPEQLDRGFTLPLQERAQAAGSSDPARMQFLFSLDVQEEIDAIAIHVEGSSLDVERKHRIDKMSEKHTVLGVASASRNGIIRQWRRDIALIREGLSRGDPKGRISRRRRHMNIRSLALAQAPHLFPQAHGRLWWQAEVGMREAKRMRTAAPGPDRSAALDMYIEEHRDELEKKLADIRSAAPKAPPSRNTSGSPLSKAEWMEWFEDSQNRELFQTRLRAVRNGSRRHHNMRLRSSNEMPERSHRFLPPNDATVPFGRRLHSGFFCIAEKDTDLRVVLLVISAATRFLGFRLEPDHARRTFVFPLACAQKSTLLRPLRDWLPECLLSKACVVYKLDMSVVGRTESHCKLVVDHVREVPEPRFTRKQGSKIAPDTECCDDDSDGTDVTDVLSVSDASEVSVVMSTDEDSSGTESDDSRGSTSGSDLPERGVTRGGWGGGSRAAPHTHTAWSNEYFVLTDNRNFGDSLGPCSVQLSVLCSWPCCCWFYSYFVLCFGCCSCCWQQQQRQQ